MILKKSLIALAGLLLAPLAGAPADARVRAGMLTCSVAPGMSCKRT